MTAIRERNATIDYLRLVAALGIVWFHTQAPGHRISYLSLPFFLVLLGMPSSGSVGQRASRLLQPFVVWSIIYACVAVATAGLRGADLLSWWKPSMLFTGTSLHLWFLPFAFVCSLALRPVRSPAALALLGVAAAALVVALADVRQPPFGQWLFGIVPLILGCCYFRDPKWGWVALAASAVILLTFDPSVANITIVLGTGLTFLLLCIRLPQTSVSDWCARVSFPVYLAHFLPIKIGNFLSINGLTLALLSIAASLAFAVALELLQTRRQRRAIA